MLSTDETLTPADPQGNTSSSPRSPCSQGGRVAAVHEVPALWRSSTGLGVYGMSLTTGPQIKWQSNAVKTNSLSPRGGRRQPPDGLHEEEFLSCRLICAWEINCSCHWCLPWPCRPLFPTEPLCTPTPALPGWKYYLGIWGGRRRQRGVHSAPSWPPPGTSYPL